MNTLKSFIKHKTLFGMALPGLLWFILFCYVPMFGLIMAFQNYNYSAGFFGSPFVGFENFKFLFQSPDTVIFMRNTLVYNVVFILFDCFSAVALAIIFNMIGKNRLNRFNQTAVLLPHFLSWVVASYFVFGILSVDKGIANRVVTTFGGEQINWYAEPKYWPFILFLCSEWKHIGYSSVIYYSTIRGFDPTYYEAARIDGANWFQCIWHVTVPLLKPIVIVMLTLKVGAIMNSDFGLFYIIPRNSGMLYDVTSTIDTFIYNGITGVGDMGSTAAAGFFQSVIGFTLVMTTNAVVRKISPEDAMF